MPKTFSISPNKPASGMASIAATNNPMVEIAMRTAPW